MASKKVFNFAEPVTHEYGCFLLVPDIDLYNATVSYFVNSVSDPYNHGITLGNRRFKFWSKPGGLINPKTNKPAFEYILQWKDSTGASKCNYTIKPLFGKGTKTKTGKVLNLPTVGTQIHIQSSYIEMNDHFSIVEQFMDHIDASRFKDNIDNSKSTIYQMARHVRYHESQEFAMVQMLQKIESESSMMGDSKLIKNMVSGKYDMYKMDSPDFSICGIPTKWNHSVKSYRIKNFMERDPSDPLRHPKLEVFLHSDGKQNPSINEYLDLKKDLDNLIIKLLSFVDPIDYVSDSYFNGEKLYPYRHELPKWDYKAPVEYDLSFNPGSSINKSLQVLAYVATQSEGCTEFRTIQEATEIPNSTLWRCINHWKCEGILETVRKKVTYVFFKSKGFWKQAREPLENICVALKIGLKRTFGQLLIDTGVIRNYRERKKNIKPVKVSTKQKELIIVDDQREAKKLQRELREMGLLDSVRVALRSNKSNMRYSRVI
ncbi:hypothetical protein V7O66_08025 [Methanolobus sp. ZRKC3]|uniref:DUF7845 domain-containing protein n=1 Tax=Methanolobus sp. ZRKC3 TaxID=3125786 RepID=UPI0032549BE0